MEIAFFTDSYDPIHDGVASVTGGLARTVAALGHSVRVFTSETRVGAPSHEETVDGVSVRRIRSVPVPLYGQYRWPVFPFSLIRAAHGVKDADVVHLHTPGPVGSMGFLSARRFHLPLVGTFHTNIREMRESVPRKLLVPLFFRIAWWYNLGTYWRCDVATAPSESARETLVRSARKPFRHPVEIVPNGIDVDRFRAGCRVPDWRTRCGLPDAPLVTYLGRLTVDKGVHRFLDAVAAVARSEEVVGIVGGCGPEEAAVRDRLARDPVLASRVRYVGPVAESEKAALLGQTDLFVLPSTSDTSSVALLEAMACGAAVVAPAFGGAAEVVADGVTGRRVDVLAPETFAAALAELVADTAERRRLAEEGARWAREHASLESMARRFISLYRMVVEERGNRAHGAAG
jgi:glycosyltransferase involved in cell wall biosynthesis